MFASSIRLRSCISHCYFLFFFLQHNTKLVLQYTVFSLSLTHTHTHTLHTCIFNYTALTHYTFVYVLMRRAIFFSFFFFVFIYSLIGELWYRSESDWKYMKDHSGIQCVIIIRNFVIFSFYFNHISQSRYFYEKFPLHLL